MKNYTWIHLHTMLSNGVTNIDSITDFKDYILKAEELGMKAIAFTEHGNIFQWYKKKLTCEEHGLKYIHGIEAYITKTLDEKVRDNYHVCLYALNYEGFKEINRMSSKSFKADHKYYSPRFTFEELMNTSDNIAISTACLGGILNSGDDELENRFIDFLSKNKHRCFVEIQHHMVESQRVLNEKIYQIHKKYDIPMIVGTDTHALNETHIKGRKILQKAKNIHFDNEDGWDLKANSYDEVLKCFEYHAKTIPIEEIKIALENTNVLADMVEEYTIDKSYKYPRLWDDSLNTLRRKVMEGIKKRGVDKLPNYNEYIERIKHELNAYIHNDAIDFMLLMEDIIDWCIKQEIYVGYGRGSCNGSVIAYLLGITEMDSIKHNLNFERFMNTERVSLSDIDTDFPPSRRDEVKDYIFSKTGLYCCDIITFNTIALKGAIRDVGRALEMPLSEVDDICKNIEIDEEKLRKKYKELFEYVDIINGTIVSVGSHPCGTVVSPHDVEEAFGTFTTSTSNYPISQINMKEIDSLNYVKLDLLGLDSIELINDACKLANIERLTPDNVDDKDINVWKSIRDDTTQIFQWEGGTGDNYIKKLLSDDTLDSFRKINPNLNLIDLLSIGNSAIRPAGASYRDELGNGKPRDTGFDVLNDFLSNTYSFLVFQEQIIQFLNKYCGFTMGEADTVRRGFAKKTGTEQFIPRIKQGFTETMTTVYGKTKEDSEKAIVAFIQVIEDASSYLFSLNHSQPYSYTGYIAGYLRYYYPLEFLTTALNINRDKEDKTKKLIEYAGKIGVSVKSPKFRYSKGDYFFDKETNSIYVGIGSIKHLNSQIGEDLYKLKDNKYDSFVDLLQDIKSQTTLNSRQQDILIKIGFFSEFGSIKKLVSIVEVFNKWYEKKSISKTKISELGLDEIDLSQYATDISEKTGKTTNTYKNLDWLSLVNHIVAKVPNTEYKLGELIKIQSEILGYINYVDSSIDRRYVVVTNLDTKYSPKFDAYCINNGKTQEMRVRKTKKYNDKSVKTSFKDTPIQNGDIIYMKSCKKEQAQKKVDDEWIIVDGKFNWWINDYIKVNI